MLIYLAQVIRHGFYDRLLVFPQLRSGFEGGDEVGEFLVLLVEEELYATETRLLRFELEAPFYGRL